MKFKAPVNHPSLFDAPTDHEVFMAEISHRLNDIYSRIAEKFGDLECADVVFEPESYEYKIEACICHDMIKEDVIEAENIDEAAEIARKNFPGALFINIINLSSDFDEWRSL